MTEKEKVAKYNRLVVRLDKARDERDVIQDKIYKIEKQMNKLIETMYD